MDNMFQSPLTDADEINRRSNIFKHFTGKAIQFPFTEDEFSVMENYLGSGSGSNKLTVGVSIISKR